MPDEGENPFKKNVLFIAGGVGYTVLGLLSCVFLTESTAGDLNDLAATVDLSEGPKPCGFAVPSLAMLMTDLNFEPYPAVSGFRASDAAYVDAALRGLCRRDSVDGDGDGSDDGPASLAIARLWNRPHEAVNEDFEIKRETCGRAYVRDSLWYALTGDNLQDPLSRIRRAYVRAQPAFHRYVKLKAVDGSVCDWVADPFGDDISNVCSTDDSHAAIQTELTEAAKTTHVCGQGDEASLPSYEAMMFRLLALATLGESDRTNNGGRCFRNELREQTAKQMCTELEYSNAPCASWTPPASGTVLYPWEQHTHPDAVSLACDNEAKSDDLTDTYPTATRVPRYELDERGRYTDATMDGLASGGAALEHCIRVHEYNSRTSEFLFGLPDIDYPPDPHPVGPVGDAGAGLVNITYLPWFLDGREQAYSELKHSALRDGIAYEGFRFGFSLYLRIPALYAAAFWLGRGIILCIGSVVPALRNLIQKTPVDEVEKPSGWTLTTITAVVLGFVCGILSRLIDPLAVPESSKTTCTEYGDTGRVYDSSQLDAIRDYVASIFIFLVSAFAVVWEVGLRKKKRPAREITSIEEATGKKLRRMRGMNGILLILFILLLLLETIFCADLAIKSGYDLQLYIYDAEATSATKPLRQLENDVYFLQAVALAHGSAIGAFTTMYAFATALGQGRLLPLMLWLATIIVALAVGFTRFSHTDPDVVDEGTRGFTIALTVVVDVALGAYAFVVAYIRRSIVMRMLNRKVESDVATSQANLQEALEAPPEAPPKQKRSGFRRFAKGAGRVADYASNLFTKAPVGQPDSLPLLALNVKR